MSRLRRVVPRMQMYTRLSFLRLLYVYRMLYHYPSLCNPRLCLSASRLLCAAPLDCP